MTAQLLDITPDAYHADPAETPSLSCSIANLLCTSSPKHAWTAHPRLNPNFERDEDDRFDVGTVVHALLLQGLNVVEIVDANDWRTKAAQEQRDSIRAGGMIPLLAKDWDRVQAIRDAVLEQLELVECAPPLLAAGKPEQALVWEEPGGVRCRALIDWLHDDLSAVDDLKTTSRSANPEGWTRSTMWSIGADVQIAFYLRGLEKLTGRTDIAWRYIVVETQPPYALSVVSPGPDVLTLGRKKVEFALRVWRRCLERDEWPAYPREICWAELPPWEEARWLERESLEYEPRRSVA